MAAYNFSPGILGVGAAGLTAAAGSYYSAELIGDRTKKILRFLFDPKGRGCTPEEEVSG